MDIKDSKKIGLFRHAPDVVTVPPGGVVFRQGDPPDVMYVIQAGEVDVTFDGNHVETLGDGSLFGEMSLIGDEPRAATVTARTEAKLVPVDLKRFMFLVEETPYFAVQVMKIMSSRIRRMLPRLEAAPSDRR